VSGKRPSSGCYSVEQVSRTGEFTTRSMVYTEYFVQGTEPDGGCSIHQLTATSDQVATTGTASAEAAPSYPSGGPPIVAPMPPPGLPPTAAGVPPPPPAQTEVQQEKPKKRGFWGRLFGRRDRDDKSDEKREEKPKKKTDPRPRG
jgi:hypothetical protein